MNGIELIGQTFALGATVVMILNLSRATDWRVLRLSTARQLSPLERPRERGVCVDIQNTVTGEQVGGVPVELLLTS